MKKIMWLLVLGLTGCLEKETTFKGCPDDGLPSSTKGYLLNPEN